MATKSENKIRRSFSFEKETPGTYRMKEDGEPEDHLIGSIYLKKGKFPKRPDKVTVTLSVE